MDSVYFGAAITAGAVVVGLSKFSFKTTRQHKFIQSYRFPRKIRAQVRERYPHLTGEEADQVIQGLRDYFLICNDAGKRFISMPSQAVDTAWHEFILFTREYQDFCDKAFGRFLHHCPSESKGTPTKASKGISNAWRLSCAREKLDPSSPRKLPALFALDSALRIEDGFTYQLNCEGAEKVNGKAPYCVSHIHGSAGCGSGCGSGIDGCADAGCGGGCGGCGG